MKDFLGFFALSFIVCYIVIAFGLSNAWVLMALEAKEPASAESAPPEPEA